jgi:hypothetical protein
MAFPPFNLAAVTGIVDHESMIFYFTRHPAAPHVQMKVRGPVEDVDIPPTFTIGARMYQNLDAFVEQAQVSGLSEESLNEIRVFAYSSEGRGEAKSEDLEITVEQLHSMGFTLEHGKERLFVVSYKEQERGDGKKAVQITAEERDALPLTMPEVKSRPMLLSELNEKLYMIERTINDLHYSRSGPNIPAKAVVSESDLDYILS